MTSLKEEIEDYIYEVHSEWYSTPVCNADEILKIIEKRIDSIRNEVLDKTSIQTLEIIKELLK